MKKLVSEGNDSFHSPSSINSFGFLTLKRLAKDHGKMTSFHYGGACDPWPPIKL